MPLFRRLVFSKKSLRKFKNFKGFVGKVDVKAEQKQASYVFKKIFSNATGS